MNDFRRNRNTNDPGRRRDPDNINVDNLNVSRVNVDNVTLNRVADPGRAVAVNSVIADSVRDPGRDSVADPERDQGRDPGRGCCHRRREGQEILLNVSTGGAGPLAVVSTVLTAPIPIVTLTLDGDRLRGHSVLFNFTSIISLPLPVTVSLNFQMLRTIDNGAPVPIGPQFTFARTVTALETDSFGFQLFDSQVDADTVTYSVVLAMSSTIPVSAAVTILNATLSALEIGRER